MLKLAADVEVHEEQGTVYLLRPTAPAMRLNRSASTVWLLAQDAESIDEVAGTLAQRHDVPVEQAQQWVEGLVSDLRRRGVLEVS